MAPRRSDDDLARSICDAAQRGGGPDASSIDGLIARAELGWPLAIVVVPSADPLPELPPPSLAWAHHRGLRYLLVPASAAGQIRTAVIDVGLPATEAFTCDAAGGLIQCLRDAIVGSRKLELAPWFERYGVSPSFDEEIHLRGAALDALRADTDAWPEAVEHWAELMVTRHFPRINGVRRKLLDFLCRAMRDFDYGWGADWPYMRAVAGIGELQLMREVPPTFVALLGELQPHIRGRASDLALTDLDHGETGTLIRQAIAHMRDHATEPIGLAEVAAELAVSGPYLSRTFRKQVGTTLTDFLQKLRVQHAREQLIEGEDALAEIAERCGFQSMKHFFRTFKKHSGLSPQRYRVAHRAHRS